MALGLSPKHIGDLKTEGLSKKDFRFLDAIKISNNSNSVD